MPTLLSRAEAMERIRQERGEVRCLMCGLVERRIGVVYTLFEDNEHSVLLPRYVRRWGQITVVPKKHVTRFADIDPALWARTNELAFRAARAIEQARSPLRTLVASTGSCAGELLNSSEHLHIHAVPMYTPDDRPADIFSWQGGVYVGEPHEWNELLGAYRAVF